MFILKLFDRKGQELKQGDIVKVSDGRNIQFYSEVKYLPESQSIAPFHTFTFNSFEKVDKLPKNAIQASEPRYKIWYLVDPEPDAKAKDFEGYLTSWRDCERLLEKDVYRIDLINKQGKLF